MATLKSETIQNITAYADAVQGGYSGTYAQWCTFLGGLNPDTQAVAVQKERYTLDHTKWSSAIYNLEPEYPSDEYFFLYIDKDGENITSEQLSWWYSADMMGSMNNEILCHGTEPQVDIPVIITYVKLETGD